MAYVEFQLSTNYSFLPRASHVEELVDTAVGLGYSAIGVTDRNSVAGMVRAFLRCREASISLIPGCHFDLTDAPSLLAYSTDRLVPPLSSGDQWQAPRPRSKTPVRLVHPGLGRCRGPRLGADRRPAGRDRR
jgi:hypothetical protein